ncbi:MAG: hypothetical protein A3F16_05605 [Deltaproteobacteria bacterium RIFCSPHIGHO2_12_FULL_43_9]|nr:MAG: hypothetical protein A3F16_05605 [Deltaproteobacteria bacterium RIFCSPHIGHO2_12_FULL_43_9]
MKVSDKMQTELFTVSPVDEISKALELMANNRIRHVLVTDGDDNLVGIISDRDIKSHLSQQPLEKAEELDPSVDYYSFKDYSTVDEIMTINPTTIEPGDELLEAGRIMVTEKIGALPVVKEEKLVGIITETDVVEAFLDMLERESLQSASQSPAVKRGLPTRVKSSKRKNVNQKSAKVKRRRHRR